MMRFYTIVIATLLSILPTFAHESPSAPTLTPLRTEGAWVRAVKEGNGAAYITIVNGGSEADRLLSVKTDVCDTVELHTHLKEGDVYKMRPIESIDIPAKQTTLLEEGSFHIMLINVTKSLEKGDKVKLTLVFEKAREIPVIAEVRKTKCDCCHEHTK